MLEILYPILLIIRKEGRRSTFDGRLAQLVELSAHNARGRQFESDISHHMFFASGVALSENCAYVHLNTKLSR